jgi:large subunit ribosomal protein L22
MKAFLKNYRQSPRKVRLVADLVKGKNVGSAIAELDFLAKRAGGPIKKLLLSAVANAKNQGVPAENLFIKELRVDKGIVMKRIMPAAMGSAHRINKRTSHVEIVLAEKVAPVKSSKATNETKVKKAKKTKIK